jgi:hypothetical protein
MIFIGFSFVLEAWRAGSMEEGRIGRVEKRPDLQLSKLLIENPKSKIKNSFLSYSDLSNEQIPSASPIVPISLVYLVESVQGTIIGQKQLAPSEVGLDDKLT